MSERIEAIRKDVEEHAGCSATQRAYGWRFWEGKNAQYTVVLGVSPIDSPNAAVRASIAEEAQKMHENSQ